MPFVSVDKFMTRHAQDDQVLRVVGTTLTSVLYVMYVQNIRCSTEPTTIPICLKDCLSHFG